MKNKKIFNVCDECGLEANRLTCLKKYGREPLKPKFTISTYHLGICDICGKETAVTEPRDFFYPDFSLLEVFDPTNNDTKILQEFHHFTEQRKTKESSDQVELLVEQFIAERGKQMITKDKWVWMPHPAHLIVSSQCQFHLATKVGKYIISTVGEWWPDRQVRAIHAKAYDLEWLLENEHRLGDDFDHAYRQRFGFMEIGVNRLYETMVFKCVKDKENKCCGWKILVSEDVGFESYNNPVDATKGHYKLCSKWAKKESK